MPHIRSETLGMTVKSLRLGKGLTQKELAQQIYQDRSIVSKIENGSRPTIEQIELLERVFEGRGGLAELARAEWGDDLISKSRPNESLIVLQEIAELELVDSFYTATISRRLQNNGKRPVTSYLVKIQVDRFPEDAERSRRHHHDNPLILEKVNFSAELDGTSLRFEPKVDQPARKELFVHFESPDGQTLPLYPGQSVNLKYSYRVPTLLWGRWFQRAIRIPTDELVIRLRIPTKSEPVAWCREMSYERHGPIQQPPTELQLERIKQYEWRVFNPVLEARYRAAWRLENNNDDRAGQELSLSEQMKALGIVQQGDKKLEQAASPYDLPREAQTAKNHLQHLEEALGHVETYYPFSKGSGLAANQIGLPGRAAIVRSPNGQIVHLINPEVVDHSETSDARYEGCLSLFDLRGKVTRPLWVDTKHQLPSGEHIVTRFEDAMARLVSHEIDHLNGLLYLDRVKAKTDVIPFEEYKGSKSPWNYEETTIKQ